MKNNQTTTEATREKIKIILIPIDESHASYEKAVDEIMQLLAQEKAALLEGRKTLCQHDRCFNCCTACDLIRSYNTQAHSQEDREGKDK